MSGSSTEAPRSPYGPSLPELVGPRLRELGLLPRILLALAAAALAAGTVALVIRQQAATETYVQGKADAQRRGLGPIPFRFDYPSKLRLSKPTGVYVQAERRIDGTLAARFSVSPLRLAGERGVLSGLLPVAAIPYIHRAERRYENFRLQLEGKARVNGVEGYQFAFTARLRRRGLEPRRLFGRVVMLPEPFDLDDLEVPYPPGESPTRGVVVTMLATTLDDVPSATRVGDEGILNRSFRSFRFGS